MANDGKFLNLTSGQKTLETAISTSAGAGDANKIPKLNSAGNIDSTMLPPGVGLETRSIVASEALSAGQLINVYSNAGTLNMRKADATVAGKEANGYVLAAVSSSASGTAYIEDGTISGLSGLTVGSTYYLSTTAGAVTTTAPSTSGNVVQEVGKALSATELMFKPRAPITIS